ncbi:MAG: hypothetical protein GF331_24610, partial [Chitinivibrionales bacterium]|nr:hypothetical protein [Chitinivibrionales bacterium]
MVRLPAVVLALVCMTSTLVAGKGEITFVEAAVDLQASGRAVVAYTVQWRVLSGELHGFYFSGNDRLDIRRFSSQSYAVDSKARKYK